MKMTAKIKVLIGIGAIAGLTALSQITAGRIAESANSKLNISSSNASIYELQNDSLLKATKSVNESWMKAFSNIVNDTTSEMMSNRINKYLVMQSLYEKGFSDFQIKTLETIANGNEARHLAIWSVARELENGERELVIGKIDTNLIKQEDRG